MGIFFYMLPKSIFSRVILSWSKSSFWLCHNILWKNPNELFGQPNISPQNIVLSQPSDPKVTALPENFSVLCPIQSIIFVISSLPSLCKGLSLSWFVYLAQMMDSLVQVLIQKQMVSLGIVQSSMHFSFLESNPALLTKPALVKTFTERRLD